MPSSLTPAASPTARPTAISSASSAPAPLPARPLPRRGGDDPGAVLQAAITALAQASARGLTRGDAWDATLRAAATAAGVRRLTVRTVDGDERVAGNERTEGAGRVDGVGDPSRGDPPATEGATAGAEARSSASANSRSRGWPGAEFPLSAATPGAPPAMLCVEVDSASLAMPRPALWEPVALGLGFLRAQQLELTRLEREVGERQAELATHQRISEHIIDSLPTGLYVVDRDYRIQAWNHKRETGLQGVARRRAIGRSIFDVLHRQPATVLKREFDEVFASGRMQQFQMESDATGSVRTFRLSKIPMRLDDARPKFVTHVITIGEDITDWRAAVDRTAQSEKLAALGQMATGVMHEVNNPLATIAACAETLTLQQEPGSSDGVPATAPGELLRIIDLEVQRARRIVDGLLDFARPKPVQFTDLDLNAVVRQVLFLLQHHPRGKLISIVSELEAAATLPVRGDADRLVQVIMALVLNALDASAPGSRVLLRSAVLRASGAGSAAGVRYCVLDVVDEGHGIPRESLARVFEPFYTTKEPGRGTGLGLSICYGLIMEHGGLLATDSQLGAGATFRVVLPAAGAPPLAAGSALPRLVHEPLGGDPPAPVAFSRRS